MKPFITDPEVSGKFILPLQFEGITRDRFRQLFVGSCITGYALPANHFLGCAWLLRLYIDKIGLIQFSSACTQTHGWQEVGSLNMKVVVDGDVDDYGTLFEFVGIDEFVIKSVGLLIYDDAATYAECGIVFYSSTGNEICIAAGVSPGSVSVKAPFSNEEFDPEFQPSSYRSTEFD